jgi:hypothetical protein
MFNNNLFTLKLNQINEQRSKLSAEEHDLFVNWKTQMDVYLEGKKFININESTFIMIDNIDSCIYKTTGLLAGNLDSSLCYYTIQGLVINIDKNTINQAFCDHKNIIVSDNVIICSELTFKSIFEMKCKEIFNHSDFNIEYQYKYYTPYFKENILTKYNTRFPIFVHEFIKKMEDKLEEELPI